MNKAGRVRREKTYQTSRNNFLFFFFFSENAPLSVLYILGKEEEMPLPDVSCLYLKKSSFWLLFSFFFLFLSILMIQLNWWKKKGTDPSGLLHGRTSQKEKGKRESSFEFYTLA